MKTELKKIGFKEDHYETIKKQNELMNAAFEKLKEEAIRCLGGNHIDDYEALINDPYQYIVQRFWEVYGKNEPPHADRETYLLSRIKVDKVEIYRLKKQFSESSTEMLKGNRPTITKDGLVNNFKKESFDIYLDPAKKERYEALERFIAEAKNVIDNYSYSQRGYSDIVRFHPDITTGKNSEAVINAHNFELKASK